MRERASLSNDKGKPYIGGIGPRLGKGVYKPFPKETLMVSALIQYSMGEYLFEGETVERVVESFRGDYWVITDDSDAHPFGYACLAGMRQFAEWGTINRDDITGPKVWDVPEENWTFTGPDQIDIQKV